MKYIIVTISIFSLLLSSCQNTEIPKNGVGMFENATSLEIKYNEIEYRIEDETIVSEFSEICDNKNWKHPNNEIKKEDCELKISFVDARATLYIQMQQKVGFINSVPIIMPDDILDYINQEILSLQ